MTTFIFELDGCTTANLPAVQGSLTNVPNCTLHRTARNVFLLRVEDGNSPEGLVSAFLAPLGVKPIQAVEVPAIMLAR